jgi:hypothetical protein
MERFIKFRDGHPELAGRFIDVNYSELVSDPLATVRRIYRQLEMPLTEMTTERVRHLVSNRSRHKGYRTNRTLAELGFDEVAEVRRFSRYSLRFGVPCQAAAL